MIKKVFHLTEDGLNELGTELEMLKSQRGEIADKIAAARDFGDLSENAEYDAARTEQSLVETRIVEIEDILMNASVINPANSNKVQIGSCITLKSGAKTKKFYLVGPVEANPLEGKISNESPMGASMMGKKVGETFEVKTPKGKIEYKIEAIS